MNQRAAVANRPLPVVNRKSQISIKRMKIILTYPDLRGVAYAAIFPPSTPLGLQNRLGNRPAPDITSPSAISPIGPICPIPLFFKTRTYPNIGVLDFFLALGAFHMRARLTLGLRRPSLISGQRAIATGQFDCQRPVGALPLLRCEGGRHLRQQYLHTLLHITSPILTGPGPPWESRPVHPLGACRTGALGGYCDSFGRYLPRTGR